MDAIMACDVPTGNANAEANDGEAIMSRTGALLTLALSWLFVSPALGGDLIVPVSQDRWVSVYAFANDFTGTDEDSDSLAASDFGPFVADIAAMASMPFAISSSTSSQTSQIDGASMQATGDITAQGQSFDYDALTTANGNSHFEVTFDLASPALFSLGGEISSSGLQCSTTVTLDGPSGLVAAISAMNETIPVLETGPLAAGTYTLVVAAAGRGFGDFFVFFPASGDYDVLFSVTPATGTPETGPRTGSSFVAAPNPFRERTTISPRIPGTMAVDASIFDLQGRLVRRLAEGNPSLSWDGRDHRGELVHPGVYFVRMEVGDEVHRLKITRIR